MADSAIIPVDDADSKAGRFRKVDSVAAWAALAVGVMAALSGFWLGQANAVAKHERDALRNEILTMRVEIAEAQDSALAARNTAIQARAHAAELEALLMDERRSLIMARQEFGARSAALERGLADLLNKEQMRDAQAHATHYAPAASARQQQPTYQ